jgi:type VII secretion protein EccB
MSRDSGALYARVGDAWHPVPNLTSARLIAGSDAKPVAVEAAEIDRAERGPMLGIPGAPAVIGTPLRQQESAWAVCDDTTTTVFAADPTPADRIDRQPSVLVTPRQDSAATTYLLYEGRRAEVDLRNPAVVWALHLDGVEPRPVSPVLLAAIPEAPPIAPLQIPGAGSPGPLAGLPVGTVVRVTRADANDHFVVLAEGVQRIGEAAANLIRIRGSYGGHEIVSVAPDSVADVHVVDILPVSTYPGRVRPVKGAGDDGVLCAHWLPSGARTQLSVGEAPTGVSMELAQADGDGPNVDTVGVPPGRCAYVRATSLSGDSARTGPLYVMTGSGVLFGIPDEKTATMLGIPGTPVAAPWPVLSRLPKGPELSKDNALVARDTIGTPP